MRTGLASPSSGDLGGVHWAQFVAQWRDMKDR